MDGLYISKGKRLSLHINKSSEVQNKPEENVENSCIGISEHTLLKDTPRKTLVPLWVYLHDSVRIIPVYTKAEMYTTKSQSTLKPSHLQQVKNVNQLAVCLSCSSSKRSTIICSIPKARMTDIPCSVVVTCEYTGLLPAEPKQMDDPFSYPLNQVRTGEAVDNYWCNVVTW